MEKKQTRKIGVAGGFINQLMGNNKTLPVVGQGATVLLYSDRYAYEVMSVADDGTSAVLCRYDATLVSDSILNEHQEYEYKNLIETNAMKIVWRKNAWYSERIEVNYIPKYLNEAEAALEIATNSVEREIVRKHYYKDEYYDRTYNDKGILVESNGLKVIPGITKEYKRYKKISIIFGVKDEYRDPSF